MQRKNYSKKIALSGMSASLAMVFLLLSSLLPFATYAVPAMAGIALIPIALELGLSTAALSYVAVALLGFFILPDREVALLFVTFFGYYPILKLKIDRSVPKRWLRYLIKVLIFNITMVACYMAVIFLFGMQHVADELANGFGLLLLAMGNLFFPLYEFCLRNLLLFYEYRIRHLLFK